MKLFLQQASVVLVVVFVGGCANISVPSISSISGIIGGNSSAASTAESEKAGSNTPLIKYAASIRMTRYTDVRNLDNPRKIGTGAENVSGMSGKDIVMDQDVATIVTKAIESRLDEAGFQVSETEESNALFELGGVIKDLTYNVKARDEVSFVIETTLKEVSTGKVVWSGIVVEKNDRFAGISGNNKNDVMVYFRKELGVVTKKTTEAISSSLMAARPDLFNLTPGTKPIPGVTVLVSPKIVNAPPPTTFVQPVNPIPVENTETSVQSYVPHATATNGLLLVNTNPARAKVYLDSVYYGLSPLRLEMEPGVHSISVKLEGYKMVSEKVSVRKGDSTEMDLTLEQ